MLVLSRKPGEFISSFVPEGEIKIHLIKVQGNIAKIGIEAIRDIKVYRKEQFTTQNTCTLLEYQKTLC